ncbi:MULTISPECIES: OmpW/AlkL family protein [Cupriavidus]|uniref:OmpW n=1 Tax=Cupriavidus pinatubonensis (strain JMP 134 / LMG 1197) TaxID=264198 RepID=Q46Q13_CUPPJ|nr:MULTISPECIES: OmpW family outer membrane protein [Cupriavidus]QYY27615.1 outer membrane beta-barrel protein [Cupriavidus pinatubonensis]TPQ37800.1 OmpW family protein [Cupriavidus pinatubonensis]
MNKLSLLTRVACTAIAAFAMFGAVSTPALAADGETQGNWMVRLRATYLDMADKSDAIPALGVPSDAITVNNKWIPELDVTYFFTRNIAAELVLTVPQKQDVYLNGNRIGTFKHLPPTLLVQYHFLPEGTIRPYVGAGLNFTRIWGADIANNTLQLDNWSVAPALQIGMDYKLTKNWFLNADIKKVWLGSDVKAGGEKISKVNLDPWLFSMGVGYRF